MKIFKKYWYILLIILILFIIISIIILSIDKESEIGISNDYIDEFDLEETSYNPDFTIFKGQYGDNHIKIKMIKNINPDQVKDYISDNNFAIEARYREIESPYPGQISNKIACEAEFLPKTISNEPYDYLIAYASDRLTYGACSQDLIKYRSIIYYQYCDQTKKFYQIDIFIPTDIYHSKYEQILKDIRCKSE